jgi:hypothetical protein
VRKKTFWLILLIHEDNERCNISHILEHQFKESLALNTILLVIKDPDGPEKITTLNEYQSNKRTHAIYMPYV